MSYVQIQMLPQLIALAGLAREKMAERNVVPAQKPLLRELSLSWRLQLINGLRKQHGGTAITEEMYFANEGRWVNYLYENNLVRPRWMNNG